MNKKYLNEPEHLPGHFAEGNKNVILRARRITNLLDFLAVFVLLIFVLVRHLDRCPKGDRLIELSMGCFLVER